MHHFEGEKSFQHSLERLAEKLRDAQFLASCIPDGNVEGTPTQDRAVCLVHPGLSFVRGTLEVTLEVVEVQPSSLRYRISSKGVGSNSVVEAKLLLQTQDVGCQVSWQADIVTLGGLLKMVPSGLIHGAARKIIDDVWQGIEQHII